MNVSQWKRYAKTCRGSGQAGCPRIYRSVCDVLHGVRWTYSNSCAANRTRAKHCNVDSPGNYGSYYNACVARRAYHPDRGARPRCRQGGGQAQRRAQYNAYTNSVMAQVAQWRAAIAR